MVFHEDAMRQISADRRAARLREAEGERLARLAKAGPEPGYGRAAGRTWTPLRHRAAILLGAVLR